MLGRIMKVTQIDLFILCVECNDRDLLEVIQNCTDGWKIRGLNQIYLPVKSGPKILNFMNYGIEYGPGAEEAIQTVSFNTQKRIENVQKIRGQYGREIKFDYDVKGIYKPLDHQKVMFNMMAYNSSAALLADPGTCKTAPYLWAIDKRIQKGQIKKCLVITLSNLKTNVKEEARIQVPHLKCVVLNNKIQADKILNKGFKDAKKNIDYDIYLSNYESIYGLTDYFSDNYFDMVVLDEAHRIGSYRSRQTKAVISKFENIKYKYVVTGTLVANNSLSFFMPYRFLGPDTVPYASFYEFRRRFCFTVDPDGFIWKELSGTRTAVKEIIDKVAVAFTRDECLDLPDVIFERYECEMDAEQAKVYQDMKTNLVATIFNMCEKCNKKCEVDNACDETISTKTALTLITKLQQIASGFYLNTVIKVADDGSETKEQNIIDFKENAKLKLLIETLGNIPNSKIIIWSSFVHSIDIITDAIEKAGYGPVLKLYKDIDAFETVEKFKDPQYRILVANPSKGGVGLNIQFSNYQIFFAIDYSYIKRNQAIGRQVREGQKKKVTIIDLTCKDTIDEDILEAVNRKEELSEDLTSLANMRKLFLKD
jgi:SNF2 family DNA or RNA helicase